MKTVKLIGLLLSMLLINSCSKSVDVVDPPHNILEALYFVFQDSFGRDLIKELEFTYEERGSVVISKPIAALEVEYPEEWMDTFNPRSAYRYPHMRAWEVPMPGADGFHFLQFLPNETIAYNQDNPFRIQNIPTPLPRAEWVVYRVTFPNLFGNNNVYEIKTYWKGRTDLIMWSYCYRIVFNGKEYFPTRHYIPAPDEVIEKWPDAYPHGLHHSVVTIVLDRD